MRAQAGVATRTSFKPQSWATHSDGRTGPMVQTTRGRNEANALGATSLQALPRATPRRAYGGCPVSAFVFVIFF